MKLDGLDYLNLSSLLDDNECMVQHSTREFVDKEVIPIIDKYFEKGEFPDVLIPKIAEMGFLGINLPKEDKKMQSYSDFIDNMAVLLAGYIAEETYFDEVTTGASNDLERATTIAKQLITRFGMNKNLGSRTFGEKDEMVFLGKEIHERRDYSEKTAEVIDEEIANYIKNAQDTAKKIIKENKEKIEKIVITLLKKETIEKKEFDELVS